MKHRRTCSFLKEIPIFKLISISVKMFLCSWVLPVSEVSKNSIFLQNFSKSDYNYSSFNLFHYSDTSSRHYTPIVCNLVVQLEASLRAESIGPLLCPFINPAGCRLDSISLCCSIVTIDPHCLANPCFHSLALWAIERKSRKAGELWVGVWLSSNVILSFCVLVLKFSSRVDTECSVSYTLIFMPTKHSEWHQTSVLVQCGDVSVQMFSY